MISVNLEPITTDNILKCLKHSVEEYSLGIKSLPTEADLTVLTLRADAARKSILAEFQVEIGLPFDNVADMFSSRGISPKFREKFVECVNNLNELGKIEDSIVELERRCENARENISLSDTY